MPVVPTVINLRTKELKHRHKVKDKYSFGYYANERILKIAAEGVPENLSEIDKSRIYANYMLAQLYWSSKKEGTRAFKVLCSMRVGRYLFVACLFVGH